MTDDTLREKLKSITDNHSCYGCYDEMKSQRRKCPGLQRDLLELVHQYAEAYAESIIGPDVEPTMNGKKITRGQTVTIDMENNTAESCKFIQVHRSKWQIYNPAGTTHPQQREERKAMSRIPIKSLKQLANDHRQDIVIVFAIDSDGKTQHIATWGRSIDDCSRAADWGNRMKDKLEWPQSLHSQPSRVRSLQKRVKDLEAFIADAGYDPEVVDESIKMKAAS